jgi:hypothetical protein
MDHDHTETVVDTGSGIYRKLSPKMLLWAFVVLWAIGGALTGEVWNDVRLLNSRVTTLEAQRAEDRKAFDSLKEDIREIRADIKELLREVRK